VRDCSGESLKQAIQLNRPIAEVDTETILRLA
jgi:hypothetical protein